MTTRIWAILALAAQVLFVLTWLIAPLWQGAGYSVVEHSISDMYAETAPGGILLVVVFTICGAVTIGFALLALRYALRAGGWTSWVGSILLAASIFGIGDLLSPFERLACRIADPGCSPADQVANLGGTLDSTLSSIGVLLFIVAGFFLAPAMSKSPDWRAWAWPTRAVCIALVALLLLSAVGVGGGGLLERGVALLGAAGIAALAVKLLRRATVADSPA